MSLKSLCAPAKQSMTRPHTSPSFSRSQSRKIATKIIVLRNHQRIIIDPQTFIFNLCSFIFDLAHFIIDLLTMEIWGFLSYNRPCKFYNRPVEFYNRPRYFYNQPSTLYNRPFVGSTSSHVCKQGRRLFSAHDPLLIPLYSLLIPSVGLGSCPLHSAHALSLHSLLPSLLRPSSHTL